MLPPELIDRYHADTESVFHTWFLDEGHLKAFRTIRRGIQGLVQDLESGTFANDYRGSSVENILFHDLACNCDQMARFGAGLPTLKKLSRRV